MKSLMFLIVFNTLAFEVTFASEVIFDLQKNLFEEAVRLRGDGEYAEAAIILKSIVAMDKVYFPVATRLLYECRLKYEPFEVFLEDKTDVVAWNLSVFASFKSDFKNFDFLMENVPDGIEDAEVERFLQLKKRVLSYSKTSKAGDSSEVNP